MMISMSVYITTARKVRGEAFAAAYPEKADDLWVVAQVEGRKKRKSIGPPTPENWKKAERKAAEWRAAFEQHDLSGAGLLAPSFAEAGQDFLERGLRKRARGTVDTRSSQVRALMRHFGTTRLDHINALDIAGFWDVLVEQKGRSIRTGRAHLDALSLVFKHAAKSCPGLANPVPAARAAILGDIQHTAAFRARDQENCNPLTTDELRRLLPALKRFDNADLLITMLLTYDAGLRLGEALGLQWGDIWWGRDDSDVARHLHIQRSQSGFRVGTTKSGRNRQVAMSQRLRHVLLKRYVAAGRPAPKTRVIIQRWPRHIRWWLSRVCKQAGIRPVRPKDFRDTYASTLVTHGIVLKWVSLQLGHASLAVTERHYAAYMAVDGYQNPWVVLPGQLPPDLFVELDLWAGTTRAPTGTKIRKSSKRQGK